MSVVIDIETTGIPIRKNFNDYFPPEQIDKYESARLIQIGIVVINDDKFVEEHNHIVKPDDFKIEPSKYHNVTQTIAMEKGVDFGQLMNLILPVLLKAKLIVAHNVGFDMNILLSEMIRHKIHKSQIDHIAQIPRYCTCATNGFLSYPQLYKKLFHEEPKNHHDALSDARGTAQCYLALQ